MRGDVRQRADWLAALDGIDGVIHLAAYQDYMPDFSTFHHVNTVGATLLYELIVAEKLPVRKVVLASSQAVYGEGKYRCAEHGIVYPDARPDAQLARAEWEVRCPHCTAELEHLPITEDTVNPHTPYGISKYAAELTSFSLGRKYDIPTVNMRYSIVQGPRNSFFNAYSGIGRIFALRVLHGQPPVCYEDGQSLRDYVHVGDVARANILCLEDERANFPLLQCRRTARHHRPRIRPASNAHRRASHRTARQRRIPLWRHAPHRLLRRGPASPWLAARDLARTNHWRIHRVGQRATQPRGLLRRGPSEYARRQRPSPS